MSYEEFESRLWLEDQLHPMTGGHFFETRMVGKGYVREDVE
jgi:hypothetical protein